MIAAFFESVLLLQDLQRPAASAGTKETKLRLGTQQGRIREISVEPSAHWETKEVRGREVEVAKQPLVTPTDL